jgi:hypothetical protein
MVYPFEPLKGIDAETYHIIRTGCEAQQRHEKNVERLLTFFLLCFGLFYLIAVKNFINNVIKRGFEVFTELPGRRICKYYPPCLVSYLRL